MLTALSPSRKMTKAMAARNSPMIRNQNLKPMFTDDTLDRCSEEVYTADARCTPVRSSRL